MTIEVLLSVKDVMRHLGVSESFVRKLLQRGQLTYIKISGGVVRVRLADLETWLAKRTISRNGAK